MTGRHETTDDQLRSWLVFGSAAAPQPPTRLDTGTLQAELHGAELRHLTCSGVELAEAVYVAVRDQAWNTIPYRVLSQAVDTSPTGFKVSTQVEFQDEHVDLAGIITIEATERSIAGELNVTSSSDFEYARIGFNVVHPCSAFMGAAYTARGGRGEQRGTFPELVETIEMEEGFERPLIRAFDHLTVELGAATLDFEFTGDDFETEDQRNYGDNSFKTFSTPLDLPIPFQMTAGEQLIQAFHLAIEPKPAARVRATEPGDGQVIRVAANPVGNLPSIGLLSSSTSHHLSDEEIDLVKSLQPSHLRVDVSPDDVVGPADGPLSEVATLGVPIELAVPASETSSDRLPGILGDIGRMGLSIVRIIALPDPRGDRPEYAPPANELQALQNAVDSMGQDIPVIPGVATFFAEINRTPAGEIASEVVAAPYSPMVHAWENEIIISNLGAIASIAETVKARFDAKLVLSPVTLATRGGPWPRGPIGSDVSPRVDPRHMALVGAAWTVGLIAAAGYAGVESLTLFETIGPQGVAEHVRPTLNPGIFPSNPGALFPLGHVLSVVAGRAGTPLFPLHNLEVNGLLGMAFGSGDGRTILLSNAAPRPKTVQIDVHESDVQVRLIDVQSRGGLRVSAPVTTEPVEALTVELAPHAVAILDTTNRRSGPPVNQ